VPTIKSNKSPRSNQGLDKLIRFCLVLVFGIFLVGAVLLLFIPRYRTLVVDPQTREVWQICKSLPQEERINCYELKAIKYQNPDICWIIGAAQDDWCMQAVYENSNNPRICDQITKEGVRKFCEEYFRKQKE
jgi:hypothetical protein